MCNGGGISLSVMGEYRGPSLTHAFAEAVRGLRVLGRKSLLALFGIAVGCAAIIALVNIGHNAEIEAISAFQNMGIDTLVASFPGSTSQQSILPEDLDFARLRQRLPNIAYAAPMAIYATDIRYNGRSTGATVVGSTKDLSVALKFNVSSGRVLSDFDRHATYAVVGSQVARALSQPSDELLIGRQLQIEGYIFQVVGVLEDQFDNPLIPIQVNNSIFIPIEGMKRLTSSPQVSAIVIKERDTADMEHHAKSLREYLVSILGERNILIQIPQQLLDSIKQQTRTFSNLLAGLGVISLLVGGAGVMNVMLSNVSERRREIGIRMALGARRRDILNLFLMESVCLSISGALIGAVLGLVGTLMFVSLSGWTFALSVVSVPMGIGSSVLVGLFFGIYPAVSAAKLEPIKALRDD